MIDIKKFALRAKYKYRQSTLKRKIRNLSIFSRFLEERGLDLSEESVVEFIDYLLEKGYTPGSIRNMFYDIQSYCRLMMVGINLDRVRELVPPLVLSEAEWLTPDEVRKLIEALPQPFKTAAALMYTYARRPGEVLQLSWRDVDFDKGKITFKILKKRLGKDETATYDLEDWIKHLLLEIYDPENERVFNISQKHFNRVFRKTALKVLGRKVTPHSLRHSRITHLRQLGVPIDVVSKYIARHAKIETTIKIYRHVAEEEIREIPSAEEVIFKK